MTPSAVTLIWIKWKLNGPKMVGNISVQYMYNCTCICFSVILLLHTPKFVFEFTALNMNEWKNIKNFFFISLWIKCTCIMFSLHVHVAFLSQLWKKIKIKLWEVICVSPGVDFGKAYDIQAHLKNERFYAAVTLKV